MVAVMVAFMVGSSPLARGPLRALLHGCVFFGLIPARAGTTWRHSLVWGPGWAHPRSRGDHRPAAASARSFAGSSPLARGPLTAPRGMSCVTGLIPARAGTTKTTTILEIIKGAHPRSRGDHPSAANSSTTKKGSSPLARGPLVRPVWDGISSGLIPARAGTTLDCAPSVSADWAHPRSRGDHGLPSMPWMLRRGSSPLARGPHTGTGIYELIDGLIPARAGTTAWAKNATGGRRAHPRSRGDHEFALKRVSGGRGSSPLARGPQAAACSWSVSAGLIPARAGTTNFKSPPLRFAQAHPRSRGDHMESPLKSQASLGSSPLARGPPLLANGDVWPHGLIPARAGTTWSCLLQAVCPGAHPRSRGDHASTLP